jgi:hypothetical protein
MSHTQYPPKNFWKILEILENSGKFWKILENSGKSGKS